MLKIFYLLLILQKSRTRRIEENKHEPNILVIVTTKRGKDDIFDKLVNKERANSLHWDSFEVTEIFF